MYLFEEGLGGISPTRVEAIFWETTDTRPWKVFGFGFDEDLRIRRQNVDEIVFRRITRHFSTLCFS